MKGVHVKREPALTWISEGGVEYTFNLRWGRASSFPHIASSPSLIF